MIAAIYSRKSKFTGKGESLENQIQLCKEHAKRLGITEFLIYDKDEGYSGGNTNRPDFQRMLKDAKNKRFDILICYRLDRISRNVSDFSNTIEVLNKYGIDFISIREQFDTTTPIGRAMMYISSVFAQLERETIAERIRDNMLELSKTGRWLGGTPPFGFKSEARISYDENMKEHKMFKLSPIAEDMAFVKEIYEMYLDLGSISKVYKELYKADIFINNKSSWDIKYIQLLLRNPVYVKSNEAVQNYLQSKGIEIYGEMNGCGILTYNKKDSKSNYKAMSEWIYAVGGHEGAINADTWLKVQKQLDENKSKAPRLVSGNYGLLNGVLQCAHCGGTMHQKMGHVSAKTGKLMRYYVCSSKLKPEGIKCKCRNVRLDAIEPIVIKEILKFTSAEGYITHLIENYKNSLKPQDTSAHIIKLDGDIKSKKKQIDNLVEHLSLDSSLSNLLISKIKQLEKELLDLNKKRNSLTSTSLQNKETLNNIEMFSHMLLNFKALFEHADYKKRKQLLKEVIDKVNYDSIGYSIEITPFTPVKKIAF